MAAAVTAFTLSFFLVEMFSCLPVTAIFDLNNSEKKCIAWVQFYVSQAAINCFIDLVLVLFSLPLLGILKIDRKQRYPLVLIFLIRLLPLVATTIRLCYITATVGTKDAARPYGDMSWKWRWITLWSQIEVDVGIVAVSLPSLSPLVKQMWSGFAHTRSLPPSRIPTLIEPELKNRGRDARGLQKLPSTVSTLPNKSVLTLGEPDKAKRLTFFDDSRNSEEGDFHCEAFPDPYGTTQIGVARTINTRLSRATFVDMPASPRRDGLLAPSVPDAAG